MGFRLFRRNRFDSTRQRMIHEHASWLSRMLVTRQAAPRIPTRRVSAGGFARLMRTPEGREIAFGWWEAALKRMPR